MSLRILESWDGYGGSATASASNGWQTGAVFTTTHAKTGAYALGGTGASGVAISRGFGNQTTSLTFDFGIWIYWTGTAPAQNGCVLAFVETAPYNGTNAQCGINANASHQLVMVRSINAGTTLQTSAACLNTNDWNYITGTVLMANAGTWDIYCNGVQVLNGSGDTQATATVQVGGIHVGTGATYWLDSIWVMQRTGSFNNTHPGLTTRHITQVFQPNGSGATTGLTPSAGTNWQNVDEAPPNSDTDYNSGASNAYDTYAVDWASIAGRDVLGIIVRNFNRSVAGAQNCNAVLRVSGTDNHSANFNPPTTYQYNNVQYDSDPTSAVAWTAALMATSEIGWRAGGTTARLSQIYADVLMTEQQIVAPVAYLVHP